MKKLESEDLPFVKECKKLREITGCIRACFVPWNQNEFMGAGLLWMPVYCLESSKWAFFNE